MSRWPFIGKSRVATVVLLVLCCVLLSQACSANDVACPTPHLTDVEHYVDCNYDFYLHFHSEYGLSEKVNGFWVFLDEKVVTDPGFNKDCVQIKWDKKAWKPAYDVKIYGKEDLPDFAPDCADKAIKIWIAEGIPHDQDVTIWIKCLSCPEPDCPYQNCPPCSVCKYFKVWVNNDNQLCPQESSQIVKVIASSGTGGHVSYPPTGDSAAPDFETYFDYGATPTYLITGESHIIDTIDIDPLCEGVYDPPAIVYRNGTVQATYTFDELHCSYKITASFLKKPVYGYLKYQLPQSECGDIILVKVYGTDKIQDMLDFADQVYLGGNSAKFDVHGWSEGTHYGSYAGGIFTDDQSCSEGDTPLIKVTSNPITNPETFKVSYEDDDPLTGTQYATVTILTNGNWVWAPYLPDDVTDIVSIEAQQPAWQMVTQDYLDCHKDWEGLIGMVIEVDNGTYKETIEIDTPGVHLKNKEGASPVIDAQGIKPEGPDGKSAAVFLSSGCTGIEGFTIKNSKTNGVLVWLSSEKCCGAYILDCHCGKKDCQCEIHVPCCKGRINIVKNDIFNNCENGIYVKDAVVLILENKIHENIDDGIDAGCLFCGVECIDPEAITHSPACSEIIYNTIYKNGHFPETGVDPKGEWEVVDAQGQKHFTSDPTGCGALPGWTDAGIQIRCVGSDYCKQKPCCCCKEEPSCDDAELFDTTEECEPCSGGPGECDVCTGQTFDECESCGNGTTGECGTFDETILIQDKCGGCYQRLYIKNNNIYENYDAGIYLMEGATQGGRLIIQHNQIHENRIFGLLTEAKYPCLIDFRWNDIWCNRYWGVKNLACCDLVAKENYWGSAGGPSSGPAPIVDCIECRCHEMDQRSEALGNGDEVSHRVHYDPWLYRSAMCMLDGTCTNIRIYGSELPLDCGWNTLSVPVKLATESDTFIEIAGIGKFITPENFAWVLRWDAKTDTWVDAGSSGEQIIPGRGYYIKMKADSKFPVLYHAGPSPGLTSVPLESGWNLIGTTWGIDREDGCCDRGDQGRWGIARADLEDDEAFMQVTEALESIKEGNGGTKGVAIIVSPSVPGQYESWSASVTSGFWDPIKNTREMATGDAYWVFMANPSTYAGFEITPFYFPDT